MSEIRVSELTSIFADDEVLLPVVVQEVSTGEVLMLAYANRAALEATLATRKATYFSRSRQSIWVKGESSGNHQSVSEVRFDCDSDAILYLVEQEGVACHTGEQSCFHNHLPLT